MEKTKKTKLLLILLLIITIGCGLAINKNINEGYTIEQLEIMYVEENQEIKSNKNKIINSNKFVHISLDDFITAFENITKNQNRYSSIFENDTFLYLKMLHDKYGAVISCYVYYESDNNEFDLSQCTNKFAEEFKENSDWLKFGFHTLNGSKNYANISYNEAKKDYDKVINELLRITGTDKSIDTVVRLQNFAGNEESIKAMMNTANGVQGVLGADDKRRSYYLSNEYNSYLYTYDYYINNEGLDFFRTDLRLESIDNINQALNDLNLDKSEILIVFTHEWQIEEEGIKEKLEKVCEHADINEYAFDYPMNRIN